MPPMRDGLAGKELSYRLVRFDDRLLLGVPSDLFRSLGEPRPLSDGRGEGCDVVGNGLHFGEREDAQIGCGCNSHLRGGHIIEKHQTLHIAVVSVGVFRKPRIVAVNFGDGHSMDDGYGVEEGRDEKAFQMHDDEE